MKILISLTALALLTALSLQSGCDYGSKRAFANSIRAAGKMARK